MLVGDYSAEAARVARLGRAAFLRQVRSQFPQFSWHAPLIEVPAVTGEATPEPVTLLDAALVEREGRRLDFAFAIWAGEMSGYERPHPMGAPSAIIGCAAAAIGRLLPESWDDESEDRRTLLAQSGDHVRALVCHLLGHLVGLGHVDDATDFLHAPHDVGDLARMTAFGPVTVERLQRELADVADPRLEERPDRNPPRGLSRYASYVARSRFAVNAAWDNRDDVWLLLKRAKPWFLPLRLGRLVTAAASTLVILLMTAEAWEAGMSQTPLRLVVLSVASLVVATAYLVNKQRLLVARPRRGKPARHSEQRSVGNVAVVLAVLIGMTVTYAALFVSALIAAWVCYPTPLVENWAASVEAPTGVDKYLRLAAGVAALGLGIGALGASFEPRGYVRHVAYVDEEV